MKSKVFLFILGTAVGVAIGAAIFTRRAPAPAAPVAENISANEAPTISIANLESELASVKDRLKKSEQQNDLLSARVQSLNQPAATPSPAAPEEPKKPTGLAAMFGDGTNGVSGAMREAMRNAMTQQFEAKIAGMKAKLNLSPEQEAAIRELMDKQATQGLEMAQKMFKGEMSEEEMKESGKSMNQEEQIKALLTPEQVTAYDEFEKEEKTRMARLANTELLQLQSQLRLTEEQQDKVFGVLVDQAQGTDVSAGWDSFQNGASKKAEALRSVLTPEQFERYQKFQEQQRKLIEAFMPKLSSNSAVRVSIGE